MKLFLGPSHKLIQPFVSKGLIKTHVVPFGYWYKPYPFEIIREASYLEIYIMSRYTLNKPIPKE